MSQLIHIQCHPRAFTLCRERLKRRGRFWRSTRLHHDYQAKIFNYVSRVTFVCVTMSRRKWFWCHEAVIVSLSITNYAIRGWFMVRVLTCRYVEWHLCLIRHAYLEVGIRILEESLSRRQKLKTSWCETFQYIHSESNGNSKYHRREETLLKINK